MRNDEEMEKKPFLLKKKLKQIIEKYRVMEDEFDRLLEENNNSSTRVNTDIRILSNKLCEIGDKIGFGFSGIVKGDSIQRNKKFLYAFSISWKTNSDAISPRLNASILNVPILFNAAFTKEEITEPSVTFVKRITSFAAARSTRSIALSGKKRSVI